MIDFDLPIGKKIYFASDFHLGAPSRAQSIAREKQIVQWLDAVTPDMGCLFLMGDVFDFWFEYQHTIPKNYVRLLGKIAHLTDAGVPVYFFLGNHDMWTFGYLQDELKVTVIKKDLVLRCNNKLFYLAHGDGLGKGDYAYKFLKKVFRSTWAQWFLSRIHPNFTFLIANTWSNKPSKYINKPQSKGEEEWLVQHSYELLKNQEFDFLIFGHRHVPLNYALNAKSRYLNCGDWIWNNSYVSFNGIDCKLNFYLAGQ